MNNNKTRGKETRKQSWKMDAAERTGWVVIRQRSALIVPCRSMQVTSGEALAMRAVALFDMTSSHDRQRCSAGAGSGGVEGAELGELRQDWLNPGSKEDRRSHL